MLFLSPRRFVVSTIPRSHHKVAMPLFHYPKPCNAADDRNHLYFGYNRLQRISFYPSPQSDRSRIPLYTSYLRRPTILGWNHLSLRPLGRKQIRHNGLLLHQNKIWRHYFLEVTSVRTNTPSVCSELPTTTGSSSLSARGQCKKQH